MNYRLVENYIYMYHLDAYLILPQFPENISDNMAAQFQSTTPLSRSAPIFSYSGSGPRSLRVNLKLHRDMMTEVNINQSNVALNIGEDYVDKLINELQAIVLPRYDASTKLVDPPMVAVRIGNDIYIKGVVQGGVGATYSGPILENDKYAVVDISFDVSEVDPYDASMIAQVGSFRGINTTLERNIFKSASYGRKIITRATR